MFTWRELGMYQYDMVDVYFVNMTSQRWLDGEYWYLQIRISQRLKLKIMIG